ncbi:MAG: hypothetical protein ACI9W4_001461 [Rhodothermales bacterium]|jgi:hypothetical protein
MIPSSKLIMLALRLAETLDVEASALEQVRVSLTGMLAAVRSADPDALQFEAGNLQERAHNAAEFRAAHTRQIELFFRVVGTNGATIDELLDVLASSPESLEVCASVKAHRQRIRDIAADSGRLVAATDYALRCAGQINHELIMMLHSVMQPDGGRVYTARGGTKAPNNRRSMIDRVG